MCFMLKNRRSMLGRDAAVTRHRWTEDRETWLLGVDPAKVHVINTAAIMERSGKVY